MTAKGMTARELLSDLRRMGPQSLEVLFTYLANHWYEFRLENGTLVRHSDAIGAREFLLECAAAAKLSPDVESTEVSIAAGSRPRPQVIRQEQPRWKSDPVFPDCDHVHEGRDECAKYLGEGKFCRCESRVTA